MNKRVLLISGIIVFIGVNVVIFSKLESNTTKTKEITSGTTVENYETTPAVEAATTEEAPSPTSPSNNINTVSPTPAQGGSMNTKKTYAQAPAMSIDKKKSYQAILTTSKGKMTISLFAQDAPITVNNFVFLAKEGFYSNTIFHRIMANFMIQGGDPQGNGMGGPGYSFADEPVTGDYTRGTIAMANSGPNTNGSQFFIMHANVALKKDYVIFGAIDPKDQESLATLDAIAKTPVGTSLSGEPSKPMETISVQQVEIVEK